MDSPDANQTDLVVHHPTPQKRNSHSKKNSVTPIEGSRTEIQNEESTSGKRNSLKYDSLNVQNGKNSIVSKFDSGEMVPLASPMKSRGENLLNSPKKKKKQKKVDIFTLTENKPKMRQRDLIRQWMSIAFDSRIFQITVNVFTIYALFGDDLKTIFVPRNPGDVAFDTLNIFCIVLFSFEILISVFIKDDYFPHFFFLLDLISTITIIFDLSYVSQSELFASGAGNSTQLARAGRASRIGTKAGRVMRLTRMIRLVKLYKSARQVRSKRNKPKPIRVAPEPIDPTLSALEMVDSDNNLKEPQRLDSFQQLEFNSNLANSPKKSIFSGGKGNKFDELGNIPSSRPSILILQPMNETDPDRRRPETPSEFEEKSDKNIIKVFPKGRKSLLKDLNMRANIEEGNSTKNLSLVPDRIVEADDEASSPLPVRNPRLSMIGGIDFKPRESKLDISRNQNVETDNDEKSVDEDSDEKINEISLRNVNEKEEKEDDRQESRVGKKLSELTTKRVIIIVLVLIFIVPLFTADYYFDVDQGYVFHMNLFKKMIAKNYTSPDKVKSVFNNYLSLNQDATYPLFYVNVPQLKVYYKTIEPSELRPDEISFFLDYSDDSSEAQFEIKSMVDMRYKTKMNALLNILRTLYVSLVLTIGSLLFSMDANKLALRPIERMIEKVNKIASNPLSSKEDGLKSEKMQLETTLIENAIVKIGVLLALGFGDAGSEIIAQNLARGGDVDPMLPGKRKWAIFGFCDIRNFTDATEVLQEEVMVFVNTIADLVHRTVDKHGGAANKNIGDAFLLVWKLPDEENEDDENGQPTIKRTKMVKNITDLALISFLKIVSGINKKPSLLKYREHEGLNRRLPNYKIKMGFGLHIGWAIEGAIGSEYKIDASYLSPNVNMASRLEAATKQYGVPILISHQLASKLSNKTRKYCRQIDRVTVKGSKVPLGLLTVDLDIDELGIGKDGNRYTKDERAYRHKQAKAELMELVYFNQVKMSALFQYDKDLVSMTRNKSEEVDEIWQNVYDGYISGDWSMSKRNLDEYFIHRPEDGPGSTMLNILKEHQFMAPASWPGYRELTEK